MRHEEFYWQSRDAVRLYARCWRPEEEPRAFVCLVHGLGEHSARYLSMAEAFTHAGFALLTFDLRGHGHSAGPRGHAPSYEALLDDVTLLLAQAAVTAPHCPRFLFGHSLGGSLVLNYALRRTPTLAGVIACSPALHTTRQPPAWKRAIARYCYHRLPSLPLPCGIRMCDCTRDKALARAHLRDPLTHPFISARLGIDMLAAGEWALEHAGAFALPLLLMHGGEDRIASANACAQFAHTAPCECDFKLWDEMYHELHNDPARELVFAYIIDWMLARLNAVRSLNY